MQENLAADIYPVQSRLHQRHAAHGMVIQPGVYIMHMNLGGKGEPEVEHRGHNAYQQGSQIDGQQSLLPILLFGENRNASRQQGQREKTGDISPDKAQAISVFPSQKSAEKNVCTKKQGQPYQRIFQQALSL